MTDTRTSQRRRVPLAEMADAVWSEAVRVRASQEALVSSGCSKDPDPQMIQRAEAFEAARWILLTINENEESFRAWLKTARKPS